MQHSWQILVPPARGPEPPPADPVDCADCGASMSEFGGMHGRLRWPTAAALPPTFAWESMHMKDHLDSLCNAPVATAAPQEPSPTPAQPSVGVDQTPPPRPGPQIGAPPQPPLSCKCDKQMMICAGMSHGWRSSVRASWRWRAGLLRVAAAAAGPAVALAYMFGVRTSLLGRAWWVIARMHDTAPLPLLEQP